MPKGTLIFIAFLAIIATLLVGINIGRKIGFLQSIQNLTKQNVSATPFILSPTTFNLQPTTYNQSLSTYTDESCGFTFSYPGFYMRQKTANQKSVIYVDPKNPEIAIAATCNNFIPRPPVEENQIEQVMLGGQPALLYHDRDTRGLPRDEIIVKHPSKDIEIIIAGYGEIFEIIRNTFRFL